MVHPAQLSIDELLAHCAMKRTRRSGPGGQHRNKVQTAVVLEHLPTGVKAEGNERRSQQRNRQMALYRLRIKLALQIRTEPNSRPSQLWQQRVDSGRVLVSTTHDDFPALLAEALDVLHRLDYDVAAAAESLSVTTSQIVKFLRSEPPALAQVNKSREKLGQTRLK